MFPLETLINVVVGVIFIGYWLVAFVIIYHFARFGIGTQPKKLAIIFLLGSALLFFTSVLVYQSTDLKSLSALPVLKFSL